MPSDPSVAANSGAENATLGVFGALLNRAVDVGGDIATAWFQSQTARDTARLQAQQQQQFQSAGQQPSALGTWLQSHTRTPADWVTLGLIAAAVIVVPVALFKVLFR